LRVKVEVKVDHLFLLLFTYQPTSLSHFLICGFKVYYWSSSFVIVSLCCPYRAPARCGGTIPWRCHWFKICCHCVAGWFCNFFLYSTINL